MTGWRHAEQGKHLPWPYDGLVVCSSPGCICTTPTPDAGSPCGFSLGCDPERSHRNAVEHQVTPCMSADCHPHVPTRCGSCGHPIGEEDR